MNKLDAGLVTAAFEEDGYSITDTEDNADVVLFNTCSVRANAENRVHSRIGYIGHLKKTRPHMVLGIIGCMAQRLGEEFLKDTAVDIVCGPSQIPDLLGMVNDVISERKKIVSVCADVREKPDATISETLDEFEYAFDSSKDQKTNQAFVRVMRGCNNFCSYCIVPFVRGPEVSRKPQQIFDQCKKLVDEGAKQITLLGQTVNSYEYSAGEKTYRLPDLLEMLSEIDSLKWLRFITSYPNLNHDEDLFKAMGELDKVCPYLHMPAQSGSDRILKAMNRHYSAQQYLDQLAVARSYVPDIAIAGDFIVGFPGETDEDFEATVELVKKANYKNIFAFKYSPRPGTKTDKKLEDNIPEEIKKLRNNELLKVQEQISAEYNKRYEGKILEVLVEGPSKKAHLNKAQNANNPQLIARTATDHIVVFNGPESLAGNFAQVEIEKTMPLTLFGNLV